MQFRTTGVLATLAVASASLLATAIARADDAPATATYPPVSLGDTAAFGRNVQRTMRLLATSTPEHRNTVRVLFYGQSITEQAWWKLVADDLRRRYPHADLVVENRALGGYASQMLVKTAETDLYPFYPDLVVFHVFGAHDKYEDILRRVRERTTAEILQQNDHVTKPADLTEETDPAKLPPKGEHWPAFMNHNWLPSLARKYGTEYCDQRAVWKRYLTDNHLEPKALLKDGVHLNPHGEYVMAQCVSAHLRYDPSLGTSPAEEWVTTLRVGEDLQWQGDTLRAQVDGNRIDVILNPAARTTPVAVRIDGRKPSETPELYGFTRAASKPGGKWPPLADLSSNQPLLAEDWTLTAQVDPAKEWAYTFRLTGSRTGHDGDGRTDRTFTSNSGRVVIEPDDWNTKYALGLAGLKTPPPQFTARWSAVLRGADQLDPSPRAPEFETAVTVAQGLPNAKHDLELSGPGAREVVHAIRVYHPPLGRKP